MADATAEPDEEPKKKGILLPLIIGIVLAGVAGAGGFFAVSAGLLASEAPEKKEKADSLKVEFVPLDPLVVSIGRKAERRHLRFSAQLEVKSGKAGVVRDLSPRITDVLNGYLRAVDVEDIEDPSSLIRLRAQMLRRIQIVVGQDAVADLLIIEFVLN